MIEKNESVVAGLKKMREGLLPGDSNDLLSEAIYSIQSLSKANDTFVGLHHKNRELTAEVEKLKGAVDHENAHYNAQLNEMNHIKDSLKASILANDKLNRQLSDIVAEKNALKKELADTHSLLFQSRETVGRQLDIIENLAQVLDKVSAY